MKDSIVIACGMQEDEIRKIQTAEGCNVPIRYMKRGLHQEPSILRALLQEQIDDAQEHDTILLTYGLCGGGTEGLCSRNTRLVLPRFHDCIHQLLENRVEKESLYVTRAWTLDDASILNQCMAIQKEYGQAQGNEILCSIYGNYKKITMLDTDSYPISPVEDNIGQAAEILHLDTSVAKTECNILKKLFRGEWDEDFIVLSPGETVTRDMFL